MSISDPALAHSTPNTTDLSRSRGNFKIHLVESSPSFGSETASKKLNKYPDHLDMSRSKLIDSYFTSFGSVTALAHSTRNITDFIAAILRAIQHGYSLGSTATNRAAAEIHN